LLLLPLLVHSSFYVFLFLFPYISHFALVITEPKDRNSTKRTTNYDHAARCNKLRVKISSFEFCDPHPQFTLILFHFMTPLLLSHSPGRYTLSESAFLFRSETAPLFRFLHLSLIIMMPPFLAHPHKLQPTPPSRFLVLGLLYFPLFCLICFSCFFSSSGLLIFYSALSVAPSFPSALSKHASCPIDAERG
jgi:hypothetical protein